jgi:Rrf2 family protein
MALKVMMSRRQGELTTAKDVVEVTGAPFDATARVMQQMVQRDILRSEQGAHGGYLLVRDLNKVSLHELMEVVLGPLAVARCLHADHDCELVESCNIVTPVQLFNKKLADFYKSLSVADLLRVPRREAEAVV